ncbi:sugar ABC transporter substrate-binding protein [Heliobacterium chlorum]|uniref:Sugar ABC transporter substrate-binding protein n=1 Tax=Heliobacterium chlorum TaxID=2698 RepID=A0ABR7T436_HELCL|nr:sugar ABC transporter substrate-binding protein [Heliobacterium chlorum]MBC9784962.1 sugar ABC transporter substrate-binding protein [Heliobacterium chlorum]
MKAKVFSVFLILIALLLVACGNSASKGTNSLIVSSDESREHKEGKDPTDKKKIALVMKTLTNPFFVEMEKGARRAENELGVDLIVKVGAKETSIEQQIAIVDELIRDKVDAIVIAPGSSTELIPVLKKAQEAKIPIVNIDNRLDPKLCKELGLIDVPFISVNNEQGAYLSAKVISDKINSPTEAVILEGIQGTDNGEQRKRGALRALGENKNVHVIASQTGNWKIDEAYEVTAKLFQSHPNIGAIFCANDMMALGAIQYLEKTEKKGVLVAGYDALDEAKKAIRAGKLAATIDQQADLQGYTGIEYAYKAIRGEKNPLETMIDVKVIHAGNLE